MLTARDLEKQTRPKEAGAADGMRDFPEADDRPYASKLENDVETLCEEEIAREQDRFVGAISDVRKEVTRIANAVPVNVTAVSGGIRGRMQNILMQRADSVRKAAADLERKSKDYRKFKVLNGLTSEPHYAESKSDVLWLMVAAIAFESAANAYFFGQASDAGIVGGYVTAVAVSFINVVLGFVTGAFALRYMHHVKRLWLLLTVPALLLLVPAAILLNLIIGHYREVLILDPDAIIVDIRPALSAEIGRASCRERVSDPV